MNNTAHSPFFISQSKTNFHVQHIIPVPAGVFALKSCSCCCCPLPFKLRLFIEPICKLFCFESCVVLRKRGGCIPKYHFAKLSFFPDYYFARISFCQNIVMPKYQNWVFPNYQFATICSQIDGPKSSQNNNLGRPHWGWWFQWNRRPLW